MTSRALASALVATAALAGCGGASNGDEAVNGQGHGKLPPPYVGPARPLLRLNLDAGPANAEAWSTHPSVRPGQEIALRLRIRNAGSVQTGDVVARLQLPPSLVLEPATVAEFPVSGAEPGQPFEGQAIVGRGVLLGPFLGYEATQVRAIARVRPAGGPLRATATVAAPGTSARDTLTVRLS